MSDPMTETPAAALSLLLRRAARDYLRLAEGDYWPSDVADAQAQALLPFLAEREAAARSEALREAADDYAQPASSTSYLTPEGRQWLRDRAAALTTGAPDA